MRAALCLFAAFIASSALGFTQTRGWAAAKSRGWGAGPQMETFETKEGKAEYRLRHLWLGAHLLRDVFKGSLF